MYTDRRKDGFEARYVVTNVPPVSSSSKLLSIPVNGGLVVRFPNHLFEPCNLLPNQKSTEFRHKFAHDDDLITETLRE